MRPRDLFRRGTNANGIVEPSGGASRWLESVRGDVRFALRYFVRKPLSTTTIVVVLAIGIGVHAAAFSLIQSMTMRPAPGVPRDDALVAIRGKERLGGPRWRERSFSYPEFLEFAAQRDVFASVAGWTRQSVALDAGDGEARFAEVQFVTSGFFSTIGVRPVIGNDLPLEDPQSGASELVAVISHSLWSTTFGSSQDVIGKTIRVNDAAVRIVGVGPQRFRGVTPTGSAPALWLPLSARAVIAGTTPQSLASRDSALLHTVGRLRPDATIARANAAVAIIDSRFAVADSSAGPVGRAADVVPLRGNPSVAAEAETMITAAVYEALALLILLIACTNVSALAVGAAVPRRHEIAIRLSLGASRRRLIRQLLTESSLLAVAGGALGLLVYWWLATLLGAQLRQDITPDLVTVAFTMVFALGTGILFGLSPAFHATRSDAAAALKDSAANASGRNRLQRAFVIAQIALTQPLLVGLSVTMAILLNDAQGTSNTDVAERTMSVVFNTGTVRMAPGQDNSLLNSASFQDRAARNDAAMERVAALPGVLGVIRHSAGSGSIEIRVASGSGSAEGQTPGLIEVRTQESTPGYFALLDVPIIRGRDFVATDTVLAEKPIIIGSELARELWGSQDPLGRFFEDAPAGRKAARQRYVVVGVYDSRRVLHTGSQPVVHLPLGRIITSAYLVRTVGPAEPLIPSLRSLILGEIPRVSLRMETLAARAAAERGEALSASAAAGGGGLLALLLASIGLYGVVALALGQRRREIGVRMALGARPRQVVGMLFWSGLQLSVFGLLLGLPLSVVAMKVMAVELTLPDINMVVVGAGIAMAVIAVASVATWLPARGATGVDPMTALRTD